MQAQAQVKVCVNWDKASTSTSIRKRNYFLLLHHYVVCVNWDNCKHKRKRNGSIFLSVGKQTNVASQNKEKHCTCVYPCAYAYITRVNILVLIMLTFMVMLVSYQPLVICVPFVAHNFTSLGTTRFGGTLAADSGPQYINPSCTPSHLGQNSRELLWQHHKCHSGKMFHLHLGFFKVKVAGLLPCRCC